MQVLKERLWAAVIICASALWVSGDVNISSSRRVLQYARDDPNGREAVKILMDFKQYVTKDPHEVMVGWGAEDPHPCGWRGVACDPRSIIPTVIALELPDEDLEGMIPSLLSSLVSLQRLDLSGNGFAGFIPLELTGLTSLKLLALSANNLTGEIPPEIGKLTKLQNLLLGDNKLRGGIPDTIGLLVELDTLDLAGNELEGFIPGSISKCANLRRLGLQRNRLFGSIPSSLGSLANLEILNLHDNGLTGEIPEELGDLEQLVVFNLAHNNLTGLLPEPMGQLKSLRILSLGDNIFDVQEVPVWLSGLSKLVEIHMFRMNLTGDLMPLLVNLPDLEVIDCWGNLINGSIPPEIGNLRNLTTLDLTANQLFGGLPAEIGLLTRLRGLHLWGTRIGGKFPSSIGNLTSLTEMVIEESLLVGNIPPEFGRLKNLRHLCIPNNDLEGPLPDEMGNLTNLVHFRGQGNSFSGKLTVDFSRMKNLNRFDLSDNEFKGPLPSSLANCPLYLLNLSYNHFQGEIPASYGRMNSLQMLYLDNNRLTGKIPVELTDCSLLGDLRLASNLLSGSIPESIGKLLTLSYLNLYDNRLTGEIPFGLSGCINLIDLNLASNELTGPIYGKGFGNFSRAMTSLDLSDNKLVGLIPPVLGQFQHLQILDLSNNRFAGTIPGAISNAKALQSVDFSNNKLEGEIPVSLGQLSNLVTLDLSGNNLSGSIPNMGVFLRIPASSFLGNPNLCGTMLPRKCQGHPAECKGLNCKKVWIPMVTAFPSALILGIGVYVWWLAHFSNRQRSLKLEDSERRKFNTDEFSSVRPPGRFSAEDLLLATENFHHENVLGSNAGLGTRSVVYKGFLPGGKTTSTLPIVMKVLHLSGNSHDARYMAEIDGEVKTLLKVRHSNVVKILGYSFSERVVAFMLELMPNGSLADQLHKRTGVWLSWQVRLDVAHGVASGLVYLHHEVKGQVIHRDLKPSNILLDENFKAKISDFGISKLMTLEQEELSVSSLSGTRGYIPPEYATSPRVSSKGDVYSFGVVLLELLTGKQPLDRLIIEQGYVHTAIVEWVAKNSRNDFRAVLDSRLAEGASQASMRQMELLLQVSKMCTQENPKLRPDMRAVLDMLSRIKQNRL